MIKIEITRSGLAAIGKSGYREIGRLAIAAAALHWWSTFLPLHFNNIAYLRYGYQRRNERTNRLKRRRAKWPFGEHTSEALGEVKPLVWSGRSRDLALRAPNITAKAPNYQTYRADVVINAPAFNFGAGKRIDMRDEVTRTNPRELATLQRIFAEEFNRQLVAAGLRAPKKTRRIAA